MYRTLATSVSVEGIGIHTGATSSVTLSPAPSGAGVVFHLDGGKVTVPAQVDSVVDTARCTVLGRNGITISTVEHLLSAFAGNTQGGGPITDAYVTVDGPELPIGDGGANLWVAAIQSAGLTSTPSNNPPLFLSEAILVTGKNGSFIAAYPADELRLTVAAVFDHPLVGTQVAHFSPVRENYEKEIAPARTFGFIEEVEALRKAGLALGGSEDNAVVVYPDHYSKPLHFANELARHKLLDLIGDLALANIPLPSMDIFAVKPSHRLNVEFAKIVRNQISRQTLSVE